MAIIAIGAIGTAAYSEVKYKFSDGQTFSSIYSLHALIQRENITFDKTIVLLTDQARSKTWVAMKESLARHSNAGQICGVDIKDGRNQDELWAIFDAIVENVSEGDKLYIDITNGLRHLPVLLLIACSYLRAARNVTIKSISYGAFELGFREERNGRLVVTGFDVLELLPYVALFDWASATKAFQRSGNAGVLADLLRTSAVGLSSDVSGQLENVAEKLDNVTLALELARPEEASAEVEKLTQELEAGKESLKQYAKPFALLNPLIRTSFEKIGLPQPVADVSGVKGKLETQRELIKWYTDKKHLVLAVQLAREWLISKYLEKNPSPTKPKQNPPGIKDKERKRRDAAAMTLGSDTTTSVEIHDAFKAVREVRNDIAHMGQSGNGMSADDLKDEIKNTLKRLDDIE